MPLVSLKSPISELKGAGPKFAEKFSGLGIEVIGDLLFHLPYKYQDRTRIAPIGTLRMGMAVVIEGEIRGAQVMFGKRRSLLCRVQDSSGVLSIRLFHFSKAQQASLKSGCFIRCYGEVRMGPTGLEMIHPEYSVSASGAFPPLDQRLTPLYPTTEGINQTRLRSLIEQTLVLLDQTGRSGRMAAA